MSSYNDGWRFAYNQWQHTGSVPDPDYDPVLAAIKRYLDATNYYETLPTDRGGSNGPKGKALSNILEARAHLFEFVK